MSNNQKNNLVNALLVVSGLILVSASVIFLKEIRTKDAGKVLAIVKKHFAAQGQIEGSWIDYEPIEYAAFESLPLVYIGGISRLEDNQLVQYQFACDAYTGELIDIQLISMELVNHYED